MIRIPITPGLREGPRDFTGRIGRHDAVTHWWTLQSDAIFADPVTGGLAYAARKGGAPARLYRATAPITDPSGIDQTRIGAADWPCNPAQDRDGCWAEAEIPAPEGTVSVVSVTRTTIAGSDPWGLYPDADAPQMMQVVNRTTGGQLSVRAFDPDPARREDANIGTGVTLGRVSATVTVIDLTTGAFRIANGLRAGVETGLCAAIATQPRGTRARIAIGRAWREQPIGGAFMEVMLIRGDVFDLPDVMADLRAYWDAVWEGAA